MYIQLLICPIRVQALGITFFPFVQLNISALGYLYYLFHNLSQKLNKHSKNVISINVVLKLGGGGAGRDGLLRVGNSTMSCPLLQLDITFLSPTIRDKLLIFNKNNYNQMTETREEWKHLLLKK